MSKAAFDAKLAAIDALKSAEAGAARDTALRKALADRSNYIVAKAARVIGEIPAAGLMSDLVAAFDRCVANSSKSDPQCWAKIAIVKALYELGCRDADVYLRGLAHVQLEPVWGGQEDTAGPLRAYSASALVDCSGLSDLDVLEHLTQPLFDPDKTVRAEAARAIGRIARREAALVLRVRALAGDGEPEALGAIYSALLAIDPKSGIPFVARFLDSGADPAAEAALALGATHDVMALERLRAALQKPVDASFRTALMTGIALTRLPEAIDFLLGQAEAQSRPAIEALRAVPLSEAQQARLDAILAQLR